MRKKELCIYSKKYDKDWRIVDDWKRFEQHYVYIPNEFQRGTILRNVRTNEYRFWKKIMSKYVHL